MSKIFCHIGNPKAFSTSIQQYLYNLHKNKIIYLGFIPDKNIEKWYLDDEISRILNYDLRYENNYFFKKRKIKIKKYFEAQYNYCLEKKYDLWISSENLSMRFLMEDIDIEEKINRLQVVLPKNVSFIIIFRNIWDSLRSIFFEYLKNGYTKTFNEFCKETYLYRKSNFLFSLIPSLMINELESKLCNKNKLFYLILNSNLNQSEQLHEFFNTFLNNKDTFFPHKNKSNKYIYNSLLENNKNTKSFLSASGLIENHRAFWDLKNNLSYKDEIWNKLKILIKNRENSKKDLMTNELSFRGTHLYEYLKELNDKSILDWEN